MKKIQKTLFFTLCLFLNFSCKGTKKNSKAQSFITITDYCDRQVQIKETNNTIVSMADIALNIFSQLETTEKIIGLDNKTLKYKDSLAAFKFHPELKNLPDTGKTSNPNIELILQLNPDIVLLKGDKKTADSLQAKTNIPVVCIKSEPGYDFCIYSFIGQITGKQKEAQKLIKNLETYKSDLETLTSCIEDPKKIYVSLQGKKNNFCKTMASIQSFELINTINVAANLTNMNEWGQCEIEKEQIINWNPQAIFLEKPSSAESNFLEDIYNDDFMKTLDAVKNQNCFISEALSLCKDYVNLFCEAYYYGNILYPQIITDQIYEENINKIFSQMYNQKEYFYEWKESHNN